jgi:hypothetical protein
MKVERRAPGPASAWLRRCLRQTEGYLSHLIPAGMIRGGPDRAKVSQTYTPKRIDYSLRMARRLSEDTRYRTSMGTRESARMTRNQPRPVPRMGAKFRKSATLGLTAVQ